MFRNRVHTHSTPSRGMIPQGKGREGIRKGSGMERFRNVVCGCQDFSCIASEPCLRRRPDRRDASSPSLVVPSCNAETGTKR